jgi:hypothetical protein
MVHHHGLFFMHACRKDTVLQLAYAFEKETQVWKRRPALVES